MKNRSWNCLIASSLVALTFLSGCNKEEPKETPPPKMVTPSDDKTPRPTATNMDLPGAASTKVVVQTVGSKQVTLDQTFTAKILAAREVDVRSRISGNLDNFYFQEGSQVTAGQVLFSIDPRPLQAAVRSAEASVMDARANLKFAKSKVNWKTAKAQLAQAEAKLANEEREVGRYQPLAEKSIIPQQLYDQTVSSRDVAIAQLDAAKANVENTDIRDDASVATAQARLASALASLESAQLNLDYTTITSPISGVVGTLNVYPGNLISPGQEVLATISSLDPIEVEFALAETQYLALVREQEEQTRKKKRQFELILADGEPYEYPGRFELIGRAIDSDTGTIKVRLQFPNPKSYLRPGEFVTVRLDKADVPDAILVPQRAVLELQSSKFVFVVDSSNKVSQREIEVGERYESSYLVEKGLEAGDRVVVDGMGRLKPGMTVSTEEAK